MTCLTEDKLILLHLQPPSLQGLFFWGWCTFHSETISRTHKLPFFLNGTIMFILVCTDEQCVTGYVVHSFFNWHLVMSGVGVIVSLGSSRWPPCLLCSQVSQVCPPMLLPLVVLCSLWQWSNGLSEGLFSYHHPFQNLVVDVAKLLHPTATKSTWACQPHCHASHFNNEEWLL